MTTEARGTFLREFVRHPLSTASLVPSSRGLSAQACAPVPDSGDPVVVELGAGTGPVTGEIVRRLGGRGRHLAVELNPRLAASLARRFPGVEVVVADAMTVPDELAARGIGAADVIVSGLPWAAYPVHGPQLVDVIAGSLDPDGVFTQFGYIMTRRMSPARRLRAQLEAAFCDVVVGPTVLANVPPAFVVTARRPRPRG